MTTLSCPSPAMPPEPVRRLSVEQYHAMIQNGILDEEDRLELLEGWLVDKMTKNPQHSVSTRRARNQLESAVSTGWYVDVQEPLTTDDSEPEPDVAVVRKSAVDSSQRHPGPDDVGLVVEVAGSSLARDRGQKKRVYATAGIPAYWIINLIDDQLEAFSDPTREGDRATYCTCNILQRGDEVAVVLDGQEVGRIAVAELLP